MLKSTEICFIVCVEMYLYAVGHLLHCIVQLFIIMCLVQRKFTAVHISLMHYTVNFIMNFLSYLVP